LYYASMFGSSEIVKILLTSGANINDKSKVSYYYFVRDDMISCITMIIIVIIVVIVW